MARLPLADAALPGDLRGRSAGLGPNIAGGRRRPAGRKPPRPGSGRPIDYCFFLLLPFIEIGPSYYASVGTVLAALALIRFRWSVVAGAERTWPIAAVTLLMLPALLTGQGIDAVQDFLRVAREALVVTLLMLMLVGAGGGAGAAGIQPRRLLRLSLALLAGLLLLTAVQYAALARGIYVGLPQSAYAQGADTIANDLSLRFSRLRPAATFSEPSYLAFVILSLVFMLLPLRKARRRFGVLCLLAVAIGILCQAASFVFFAFMIGLAALFDRATLQQRLMLAAAVTLLLVALVLIGSDVGPVARAIQGGSIAGDASIFMRIVGPLQVLPSFLWEHPVGVPFSALDRILGPYTLPLGLGPEDFLHNSVFNLFFEFGIFGIVLLIALFYFPDNIGRAYLLSAMLFNGAFLAFDKLAVVGFAVGVYGALQRRERQPMPSRPARPVRAVRRPVQRVRPAAAR